MDNQQNEDYFLDENFEVETGFIDSLETEEDLYIANKYMKPCNNCAEWVSKENLTNGTCRLCNMSENHSELRSISEGASKNYRSLDELVKRLEDFE